MGQAGAASSQQTSNGMLPVDPYLNSQSAGANEVQCKITSISFSHRFDRYALADQTYSSLAFGPTDQYLRKRTAIAASAAHRMSVGTVRHRDSIAILCGLGYVRGENRHL
jgi:hypothetical protein